MRTHRQVAIVTGSDGNFFPLLSDWYRSLEASRLPRAFELCLLDLGLSAEQRDWAAGRFSHIEQPRPPLVMADPTGLAPGFSGLLARPFLPDYFPGYEHYLWLDADTWVQQPGVLSQYVRAAGSDHLAACAEYDPAFLVGDRLERHTFVVRKYYKRIFGRRIARILAGRPVINTGVFCLPAAAPHWQAWRRTFAKALRRHPMHLMTDQCALNHLIQIERFPVTFLSMRCNWPCHWALPAFDPDTDRLVEPYPPHAPIQILHRTAETKQSVPYSLAVTAGGVIELPLGYRPSN
ncbi:MAG: hypothetical protein ACYC26_00190 [Phycisphaerales bacterium]